ncbi:MAG: arginine repressor [Planctomycetota bacterium]
MPIDKNERQTVVRDLIHRNAVANQFQLADLLAAEGIDVTQSTLSRDLREIGATKGPVGYVVPNDRPTSKERRALSRLLRDTAEHVAVSGTIVVIRTRVGYAQVLAQAIDEDVWSMCVGTIAGKDTVFVAMTSSASAHAVARECNSMLRRR